MMDSARIPSPDSSFASVSQDAFPPNSASPAVSLAASQEPPMAAERADADMPHPSEAPEETERHPKGRRKRTAAKDKAILEAAYSADPKPDKTARLEIVKRVTLNEKEVQIWFQNRRQNDRRRSRPLSPQEIAALRYGGMQILSSDAGSFGQHGAGGDVGVAPPPHAASTTPVASPDLAPWLPDRHPFYTEAPAPPRSPTNQSPGPMAAMGAQTPAPRQHASNHADLLNSSSRFTPGSATSNSFMAGRWHPGSCFSTPASSFRRASGADDSFKFEPFMPSSCSSVASAPILPPPHSRRNSQVRLSLSLEGKASLVSGLRSPSPPRSSSSHSLYNPHTEPIPISIPSIRRDSLHRRLSTQSITLPPISTLTDSLCGDSNGSSGGVVVAAVPMAAPAPLPPRLTRGRSRDVHAWEFAADSAEDREDELTQQARHEASGSAIAAISLLRTTSASAAAAAGASPPALQANGNKRNAAVRGCSVFDRISANGQQYPFKRAKLGRSSSSVARLQSSSSRLNVERLVEATDDEEALADGGDAKKMEVASLIATSGHDSDKENWSPDEDSSPAVSRSQSAAPAGVVGGRILPPVIFSASSSPRRHPVSLHGGNGRRTGFMDERRGLLGGVHRAYSAPGQRSNKRRAGRNPASISIFEDDGEEVDSDGDGSGKGRFGPRRDDEVERFMRGEVSPSKKGDFDCVAGLLSLSQGNWR
ncbi:hypothetical protein GGTG_12202 [Gaeumannomyces tritici R3-111a-1]|uniref:Homeobox domain-containing protein n=1 Tax=Gaeumannomyces tritici (strain R3-111a-1) TaxID=644352 RepID=J3PFC5_GAET3|nr:hypothetical protein GGTG_12202 [Gaeumannomyces tritici R3-111a-1]EJT70027.1 hypothetical protein GGTG_12202 [Gaeumannomyces tritici R3-111a-1]